MGVCLIKYYSDTNRGTFQNEQYARQLVSFQGMKYKGRSGYKNVTPTDIDGFIQLDENNCFIFFELKKYGLPSDGQGYALTSLVDAVTKGGGKSILFIAQHNEEGNSTIIAKDAVVKKMYWNGKWYEGDYRTLKDWIDRYIKYLQEAIVA